MVKKIIDISKKIDEKKEECLATKDAEIQMKKQQENSMEKVAVITEDKKIDKSVNSSKKPRSTVKNQVTEPSEEGTEEQKAIVDPDKFGPDYKREKYIIKRDKLQIPNAIKKLLVLFSQRQYDDDCKSIVLRNLHVALMETDALMSTAEFADDLIEKKSDEKFMESTLRDQMKKRNESKAYESEIKSMCKEIKKKSESKKETIVYVLGCDKRTLYVGVSNKSETDTLKDHIELKEITICTALCGIKGMIGSFKGGEDEAKILIRYLKKKYQDVETVYGKFGKIEARANDSLTKEELLTMLTGEPIEAKKAAETVPKTRKKKDLYADKDDVAPNKSEQ